MAVASGTPCLRHFATPERGAVLLYAAEDALHIVRERLQGIALAAGVDFASLEIQVITVPRLRLDLPADCARLEHTVEQLKPRLLVLDPFVRLHRIDENASGEVAPLLAYLRELQRHHGLAVLVVHHAKKGASRVRAGQALRGSSEFHAWGDSNLYLRRSGDALQLSIEHRAAPSPPTVALELTQRGEGLALELLHSPTSNVAPPSSVDERITTALSSANRALPISELRALCRVRNATLCDRLSALTHAGHLVRCADGYRLALSVDCSRSRSLYNAGEPERELHQMARACSYAQPTSSQTSRDRPGAQSPTSKTTPPDLFP